MQDRERKCRKRLRDGVCVDCGPQRGEEDLRIRMVLDDGISNVSLLLSKEPAENFLGMTQAEVSEMISRDGQDSFLSSVREKALGRGVSVNGLALIDDQGAMLLADSVQDDGINAAKAADNVIERWEVVM